MGKRKDITGQRFGTLTAIKDIGDAPKKRGRLWKCRCDCGKINNASVCQLNCGSAKNCSCIKILSKGKASCNSLYIRYKLSAKRKGHKFNLSKDEFVEITSQSCYYCGAKPIKEHIAPQANGSYKYNGIDRIDNSKGYVKKNCVPCCWLCNQWKRNLTKRYFLNHADKISKYRRS